MGRSNATGREFVQIHAWVGEFKGNEIQRKARFSPNHMPGLWVTNPARKRYKMLSLQSGTNANLYIYQRTTVCRKCPRKPTKLLL